MTKNSGGGGSASSSSSSQERHRVAISEAPPGPQPRASKRRTGDPASMASTTTDDHLQRDGDPSSIHCGCGGAKTSRRREGEGAKGISSLGETAGEICGKGLGYWIYAERARRVAITGSGVRRGHVAVVAAGL